MSISRGFQASYDVVSRALKGRDERRLKERLGQEAAQYGVTEGAYGEGLQTNIQQVEQMREQALRDAAAQQGTVQDLDAIRAQFDPSIAELQRRSGLTAPDFTVASRGPNFATRQEAETAARPMRTAGLSRVYRESGDVDKADELELRGQQQELAGLQLGRARREETAQRRVEAVDSDMSNWMTERLTGDDGTMRAPTTEDTIAAIQHRAALFQQKGLGDQAAAALQQFTAIAANQIQLQTAERNQALSTVAAGIASGDFASVQDFYDRYIPDGAKVTNIKEGRDGRITISRTTLDNEKLPATTFANRNEMLAALNSVRDPMSLYNYSQQEFKNNIAEQELALKRNERSNMRDLTTFQSTQLKAYNKWLEDPRNAKAPQADKDNKLKELGIENLIGQMASGTASGLPDWTGSGRPAAPAAPAAETGEPVPATTPAQTPGLSRGPSPARQEQMRRMPITRFTGIGTLEQAARFGNEAAIRELERRDASAMQLGTQPPLLGDMGLQ